MNVPATISSSPRVIAMTAGKDGWRPVTSAGVYLDLDSMTFVDLDIIYLKSRCSFAVHVVKDVDILAGSLHMITFADYALHSGGVGVEAAVELHIVVD